MATSATKALVSWSQRRNNPGLALKGLQTEPELCSFLSFLAVAQDLRIEFLPITWDAGRDYLEVGATAEVQQALINADTSFAFKTFRTRSVQEKRSEADTLRILIREITMLSQSFMRQHANIAQLQGICFEISPEDDKPWPVLVFEKSHLGNLWDFRRREGKNLTVDERLGICADVTRAILTMHANRNVHGDIKPQNILIFKKLGKYCAQVIDFGNSAQYLDDAQKIEWYGTEAWAAPEYQGGVEWNQSEGIEADLFSLGLLYFWLFFEPRMLGSAPPPSRLQETDSSPCEKVQRWLEKTKGNIQKCAEVFLEAEDLPTDQKQILRAIYDSSLSQAPGNRKANPFENFLRMRDPTWTEAEAPTMTGPEIQLHKSKFQIEKSIYSLYGADYRVRSHIARCLEDVNSRSDSCDIIQAALCYYLGFGVRRDEAKTEEILELSRQTAQDMQRIVDAISEDPNVFEAAEASGLRKQGHVLMADLALVYLEQKKIAEAEKRLTQEVEDLISTCGHDHLIVSMLEFSLARVYAVQERWDDCEKLELRSLKTCRQKLRADHTSTLTGMIHLATTYKNLDRWADAIELEQNAKEISASKFGPHHPDTLTSMINLAYSLWQRYLFGDAEALLMEAKETSEQRLGLEHPLTIKIMSNLACVYRKMNRLDEAMSLEQEAIEIAENFLDDDDPVVLQVKSSHALTISDRNQLEESVKLRRQILQTMMHKELPPNHSSVLLCKGNLAETLYQLSGGGSGNGGAGVDTNRSSEDYLTEAATLETEVLDAYEAKLGLHHSLSLQSYYNLAHTRKRQCRLQDAIGLMGTCATASAEAFLSRRGRRGRGNRQSQHFAHECRAIYWLWRVEYGVRWLFSFFYW